MATINFLYRSTKDKASLTLRLLFRNSEGKDQVLSNKTKYRIEKSYWKKHKKNSKDPIIKNRQVEVSKDLQQIENFIIDAFNASNEKEVTKDWLETQIDLFYNPITENKVSDLVTDTIDSIVADAPYRENGKGGIGLSQCRINSYKRLNELFKDFQGNKKIKIKELNKNKFERFKVWLLQNKSYSTNYTLKKLSDLKTVCKEARSNGVETSAELTDIKTKQGSTYDDDMDVITLTEEDINKIEKADIKNETLVNARKWLILGCYTGQRGTALTTRIKPDIFEKYGDDYIIKLRQKKGNKSVIIPAHPKVKAIYKNGWPNVISVQKLNKHFKEIGKLAKLNEPVMGRLIEKSKEGKIRGVKKIRPKYKYISTHTGRRTFASLHYGKINTPTIMKVTGHSKESTFLKYINQSDNSHVDELLEYFKKQQTKKEPQLKVVNNSKAI